jgi:hypothetical protein
MFVPLVLNSNVWVSMRHPQSDTSLCSESDAYTSGCCLLSDHRWSVLPSPDHTSSQASAYNGSMFLLPQPTQSIMPSQSQHFINIG